MSIEIDETLGETDETLIETDKIASNLWSFIHCLLLTLLKLTFWMA